jgi:hypothetical protein
MRQARADKEAIAAGKPLPKIEFSSGPDPTLTPCPHCGRSFNEKAAERHIPKCADIKAKVSEITCLKL